MPSIPKYAIGEQWPEVGAHAFVARLRNPFALALVEQRGLFSIHLHAWPDIRKQTTEKKLDKIMAALARIASVELEGDDEDYTHWSYSFGTLPALPPFLHLDNTASGWSGILRLTTPMSLWTVARDWRSAAIAHWLEPVGHLPAQAIARAAREVGDYLAEYLAREDELPQLELEENP